MSKSDFSWLNDEKFSEEFAHFELEMQNKGYGAEETAQAFYFFRAGWRAYRDSEPLAKKLSELSTGEDPQALDRLDSVIDGYLARLGK